MSRYSALELSNAQLLAWKMRPDIMVRELFGVEPDGWQEDALRAFPTTPRIAMKAAKGPGKTACLSWMAWNFLLTRVNPNIAAVSINADNLRDGLWKEMAVWRNKSQLLKAKFEWQTERIFAREAPATWWMSARAWSKAADPTQLGNTLAGLHTDHIMFLIDESGSIPTAITATAEAGLSSAKEAHIVQAGNTNMLEGALYDACVLRRRLWHVIEITGDPDNPKRSKRISIEWARQMIETYGRDSPFVKVMVLGEWPAASINALLSADEVRAAMTDRRYQQHDIDHAARVLGIDVARFGDDASIIFPRQGLVAFAPKVMRNVTSTAGAGQVARTWGDWDADAAFIDNTGGYGAGWIDQLQALNRQPIGVGFAESALDGRYYNRRAEMCFLAAEWVKKGGCLPDDPDLVAEMSQTTYTFKGDRLLIEPKEIIKAKLGRSPDKFDGLMLTFAEPVMRKRPAVLPMAREKAYDVFDMDAR